MTTSQNHFAHASFMLVPLLGSSSFDIISAKQERAKAAWIDVHRPYRRRFDLVPNLVAVLQGHATQERTGLLEVTRAPMAVTQTQVGESTNASLVALDCYQATQGQLAGGHGLLLLFAEHYPELKSNQNFLTAHSSLEGTENSIAVAWPDDSAAAPDYDTSLRAFPWIIWAKTAYAATKAIQLSTATPAAQAPPKISSATSTEPALDRMSRSHLDG